MNFNYGILMFKISEKKSLTKKTTDSDITNYKKVLSKHLENIWFGNLIYFGADTSCEYEKRKNLPVLMKKQFFGL
jgi:hypothetical protein